ncbi:MAG: archaellin/type IV pilin N-terminal domain-containing protein [Candidatus Bathyarchaeia archaeon]
MKLFKSRKALSPVVASIILIAVTVAVSIAVAAWMGALTIGFMGTEELRITKLTWQWNTDPGLRKFVIVVNNTGTKDVTITQVLVNYAAVANDKVPGLPKVLRAGEGTTLQVYYPYVNGTKYDISVKTQSGHTYTDQFFGGQDKQ